MSKAAYIHGIVPNTKVVTHHFSPLDYGILTDGELSVLLAARQSELLFLSTGLEQYKDQSRALKSLVNSTVNGIDFQAGGSQIMRWATNRIKNGNYPSLSASYIETGIGNLTQGQFKDKQLAECQKIKNEWENTSWTNFTKRKKLRDSWRSCFAAAEYISTVNQKLGDSAAHLLFSFPSGQTTQNIAVKRVLHRIAVENYSKVFGISVENVMLWLRNGILSQNIQKGVGDEQPEGIIDSMVLGVSKDFDQIGVLPAVLAVIKVVLEIITIALAATQALLSALKPGDYQRAQANTQGLGTVSFGPQKDDFIGQISESGAIWPLAAGLAALVLLK